MRIAGALAPRPVLLGKQADHEARRAVSALRASSRGHGFLGFGQFSFGRQRLHRVDLVPGGHRRQHQAAIHCAILASAIAIRNQNYRAGAAFAFRAAFFGAGEPLRADEVEQGGLHTCAFGGDTAVIQQEMHRFTSSVREPAISVHRSGRE